ncbi:hypothetical protein [Jannaschia sp. LMIT008]|uniref:hypothetical protein n=1 Tax=Jannaschia maritima TaxID=3032585 RepID=UPI00281276C7|nr:hypothetical protein [Jannaschia sp. LMIT008]
MLRTILAALALSAAALPAAAQSMSAKDPGRAFMEAIAMGTDTDRDRRLAPAEMRVLATAAFDLADADSNGVVTRTELEAADFGMNALAAHRGRGQAMETATALMFAFADRDHDGSIDGVEHAAAARLAADLADTDGDGAMSYAEFYDGYMFNMAYRAALHY